MLSDSQLLLRQVRVIDPIANQDRIADVLIADGEIKAIETHFEALFAEISILDAQGLILAPGLVDLYSYCGEPGYEERETLVTLISAAAAGGFTRLAILPNNISPVDNPAMLALLRQKAEKAKDDLCLLHPASSFTRLHFWGCLTLGVAGQQMTELAELAAEEIIGFADGIPLENLGLLRRLLEYLQPLGKPIALFPVNSHLKGNGVMREGSASIYSGLPGNPEVSETAAIASILEIVATTKTPVHLMRISTRRGVELIADAKARGLPVTASTTWMHLLLDTNAVSSYDPNLRLEPPLGNETDRMSLIAGVKQGIIDAIAVDHTPYTYEEKTLAFAEAPPGAIGLELALPLLWESFVASGEWSAIELWQALSVGPQLCLQQPPLSCMPGQPTELVLFNPKETWTVNHKTLNSHSINTPWLGKQLTGKVVRIWNC